MTIETIKRLNQLNHDFYEQSGQSFSQTRQRPWTGWFSLGKWLNQLAEPIEALDLGCGNGRFFDFLQTFLADKKLTYLGIDSSYTLTKIAQESNHHLLPSSSLAWMQCDLVQELLTTEELHFDGAKTFDLITLFGVVHHLPSYRLRETFFSQLAKSLKPEGLLIFTTWQFLDHPLLQSKIVKSEIAGFKQSDLEENDFILDWQRDQTGYRYCHYFEQSEVEKLLKNANLKLVKSYLADGPNSQANRYYICQLAGSRDLP